MKKSNKDVNCNNNETYTYVSKNDKLRDLIYWHQSTEKGDCENKQWFDLL